MGCSSGFGSSDSVLVSGASCGFCSFTFGVDSADFFKGTFAPVTGVLDAGTVVVDDLEVVVVAAFFGSSFLGASVLGGAVDGAEVFFAGSLAQVGRRRGFDLPGGFVVFFLAIKFVFALGRVGGVEMTFESGVGGAQTKGSKTESENSNFFLDEEGRIICS